MSYRIVSPFKIGQVVTCIYRDDFNEDHITVGKSYVIEDIIVDIETRIPDKICVKSDNVRNNMGVTWVYDPFTREYPFLPVEFFDDKQIIRDNKINDILEDE